MQHGTFPHPFDYTIHQVHYAPRRAFTEDAKAAVSQVTKDEKIFIKLVGACLRLPSLSLSFSRLLFSCCAVDIISVLTACTYFLSTLILLCWHFHA